MTEPYYTDDYVTIYHGDALEVMSMLLPGSVDITVTSPPYNMGLTPGGNGRGLYAHATQKARRFGAGYETAGDDSMEWDAYCAWQREALALMFAASKRAVFYNHRARILHGNLTEPLDGKFDHDRHGYQLRQRIIWDRGTGIDVNLNHFCTRGEIIYLFARPTLRLADHAASGMGDVWRLGMETGSEHPAPFPLSLPARCIAATGATSVLDPFLGSGTTLRAAKDAGIKAIGIERSERYCEIAARRCAQEVLDFGGVA